MFKSTTADDRFAFDVLDEVINELQKYFPKYERKYIQDALEGNSMNIADTYVYLKNPTESMILLI